MAFSMIARNAACTNRMFSHQIRLASQALLTQSPRLIQGVTPAFKTATTTPLMDAVRSFRTSAVRMSETPHDHARLWVIEKSVTLMMVPLIPLGLAYPNKLLDAVIATLIVAHSFWGLEACCVEYLRVLVVGSFIPKIGMAIIYLITVINLGGLFYLIFNGMGMSNGIRMIWSCLGRPQKETKSGGGKVPSVSDTTGKSPSSPPPKCP